MRKYFIGFCLSVFSTLGLNAQSECLTPSPTPPAWIFSKSTVSTRSNITSSSKLNIFVHIIRSSNGTGLTTSILQPILSSLNSYYQGVIQFNLLGSDFIDNDIYYVTLTIAEAYQLFNVDNHCNAIDIYILGTSTSFDGAGMAPSIPSKAYIVKGSYYNTSTLPHEMGHCLGLYHTHHGTINEGGDDVNQCSELVNGSNSSTCGDYITDTPADPSEWSVNSCTYTGTGVDKNGQAYNPSTSNLMSYAFKPCRTNFSDIQIQRIIDFINNTQILQNTLFSTISGQTSICSSETYTVNDVPSGCTVYWNSSSNITLPADRTTNSIVATANSIGTGWLQATINSTTCGSVTLPQYPVWVGVPYINPATIVFTNGVGGQGYCCTNAFGNEFSFSYSYDYNYFDVRLTNLSETQTLNQFTIYGTEGNLDTYFPPEGTYKLWIRGNNDCGTAANWSKTTVDYVDCDFGLLSLEIFPNPTTGETSVSIVSSNEEEVAVDDGKKWDLEVYTQSQQLKLIKTNIKGRECKLNTSAWKGGIYILRVNYKNNVLIGKLIVKE